MNVFLKDFLSNRGGKNNVTSAFHSAVAQDPSDSLKDEVFALISIRSLSEELDAYNIARFVWSGVIEEYTYFEGTRLEAVKSALKSSHTQLSKLIKNDDEAVDGVNLDICLVVVYGQKVYFGIVGSQKIHFLHEGSLVDAANILKENGTNAGSVTFKDIDLAILSSESAYQVLENEFESRLDSASIVRTAEKSLRSLPEGNGVLLLSSSYDFGKQIDDPLSISEPAVQSGEILAPIENPPESSDAAQPAISPTESRPENDKDLPKQTEYKPGDLLEKVKKLRERKGLINDQNTQERNTHAVTPDRLDRFGKIDNFKLLVAQLKKAGLHLKAWLIALKPYWLKLEARLAKMWNSIERLLFNKLRNKYGRKQWFKRFMSKISTLRLSSNSAKGMRLGGYREKQLKVRRFALFGVVLLLFLGVYVGVKRAQETKAANQLHQTFSTGYNTANDTLDKGERFIGTDPAEVELALNQAKRKIEELGGMEDRLNQSDKNNLQKLEQRYSSLIDSLNKTSILSEEVGNIETFLDARLDFTKDSNLSDITIFRNSDLEEQLFVTDRGGKAVYQIPTFSKSISKVPDNSNSLQSPQFIDIGSAGLYVYDAVAGVVRAEFAEKDTELNDFEIMVGLSPEDFESTDLRDFAVFTSSDNVYLLSADRQALLKSNRTAGSRYSLPYIYFTDPRLSTAEDVFADFSVYLLSGGSSGLSRFAFDFAQNQLVENAWSIAGMRESFENLTAAYTGADLNHNIYVFDQKSKRIMIFEKPDEGAGRHPGELLFLKQFEYRGKNADVFSNVKDMVVDAEQKNLYILDGNKVWRIKL